MAATKRKRSAIEASKPALNSDAPPFKRRASTRNAASVAALVNPDVNGDVLDAPNATRASPDSSVNEDIVSAPLLKTGVDEESDLSDAPAVVEPPKRKGRAKKAQDAGEGVRKAEETIGAVVDAAAAHTTVAAKKARRKTIKQEEDDDTGTTAPTTAKAAPLKKGKKPIDDEVATRDPEAEGDEDAPDEAEVTTGHEHGAEQVTASPGLGEPEDPADSGLREPEDPAGPGLREPEDPADPRLCEPEGQASTGLRQPEGPAVWRQQHK